MAAGTKFKALLRLLDSSGAAVWAIADGKLVFVSAAAAEWLGVAGELLLDRQAVSGTALSEDPLDALAASLSPPAGFFDRGTAALKVQPSVIGGSRAAPLEVRFVRVSDLLTLAVGGCFADRGEDPEIHDAVKVRQSLDAWRRQHAQLATIATAGASPAARRLRARLQLAAATRTHIGFFGPPGCGSDSIARRVHLMSAKDEALLTVDGPLMDAELLDATLMPAIHMLADSESVQATALVRGLDEMPGEAQQRLAELIHTYAPRLRLLALCGHRPQILRERLDEIEPPIDLALEPEVGGLHSQLVEVLSCLTVDCLDLASRVEDIPLIAAACVDARHAAGEGPAERLSRAALDDLVVYPWPRNFEELDEAIRHAMRVAPHSTIGSEHLPLAIRSYRTGGSGTGSEPTIPLDEATRRYEMRLVEQALEAAQGNRAEAARRLGISRARLLRKLNDVDDGKGESRGDR